MLNFDAGAMVKAVSRLRHIEAWAQNLKESDKFKKKNPLVRQTARAAMKYLDEFSEAIATVKPRATQLTVAEFRRLLGSPKLKVTYEAVPGWIQDIGVTFRREMSLMKTFCVPENKHTYFEIDLTTFGDKFPIAYPAAIYDFDEAGKCYALGRSTACVFHLMRGMEIGIKSAARCLGIPDPLKESDRNWGKVLQKIKAEMDRRDKATPRGWKGGDEQIFEGAYVSLDAVRVAWRNTTMHVENKYTEDEAEHIFIAVRGFMKKLASRCDEQGQPVA